MGRGDEGSGRANVLGSEKCWWGCPGGAAAEGVTGDGDAFNFLTDCVTSARRAKAGRRT